MIYWRKWISEEKAEDVELPKKFKDISDFHRLMLIKVLRPDRISTALRIFVEKSMGTKYTQNSPFDMQKTYEITSPTNPLFFVLFPGVDPTKEVEQLGA